MPGALRKRLRRLWASVTDPSMDQCLEGDSAVSSRFLTNNNITLTLVTFSSSDTAADNLNKKPPVLFLPRHPSIITDHPIDLADEFFMSAELAGAPEDDPSPTTQVRMILEDESKAFHRGTSLSHYITEWAMHGYPRLLPPGSLNLASFCNIHAVSSPHALNFETRGFRRSGGLYDIRWKTRIYEYNQRPNGRAYPHLILQCVQSCDGYANTISLGELTLIVTAMRSRAYQPAEFDEDAILVGDAEQSEDGNYLPGHEDKLAFPHETRFPVMMVSLVGPQHARFIYACMDGMTLSIRMSECRAMGTDSETVMRDIPGVLLSYPLEEMA